MSPDWLRLNSLRVEMRGWGVHRKHFFLPGCDIEDEQIGIRGVAGIFKINDNMEEGLKSLKGALYI